MTHVVELSDAGTRCVPATSGYEGSDPGRVYETRIVAALIPLGERSESDRQASAFRGDPFLRYPRFSVGLCPILAVGTPALVLEPDRVPTPENRGILSDPPITTEAWFDHRLWQDRSNHRRECSPDIYCDGSHGRPFGWTERGDPARYCTRVGAFTVCCNESSTIIIHRVPTSTATVGVTIVATVTTSWVTRCSAPVRVPAATTTPSPTTSACEQKKGAPTVGRHPASTPRNSPDTDCRSTTGVRDRTSSRTPDTS